MMNSISIIGHLVADPELKYTQAGKALCNFRVAVDRDFKNTAGHYETDFFYCTVFGKMAEHIHKHLGKGSMAGITGAMQCDQYKKDGEKKSFWKILARSVQFINTQPKGNNNGYQTQGAEDDDDMPF